MQEINILALYMLLLEYIAYKICHLLLCTYVQICGATQQHVSNYYQSRYQYIKCGTLSKGGLDRSVILANSSI